MEGDRGWQREGFAERKSGRERKRMKAGKRTPKMLKTRSHHNYDTKLREGKNRRDISSLRPTFFSSRNPKESFTSKLLKLKIKINKPFPQHMTTKKTDESLLLLEPDRGKAHTSHYDHRSLGI